MMVSTANEGKLRMCTHSVKLFKEKRKRKRGLEKFIDDERATRLVWRIGSDVALLVSYVTSKRTLYYYNSHRPLVINYLAAIEHLSGLSSRALSEYSLANTSHLLAQQK